MASGAPVPALFCSVIFDINRFAFMCIVFSGIESMPINKRCLELSMEKYLLCSLNKLFSKKKSCIEKYNFGRVPSFFLPLTVMFSLEMDV